MALLQFSCHFITFSFLIQLHFLYFTLVFQRSCMVSDSSAMATDGSTHSAAHNEAPAPAPAPASAMAVDPVGLPNNHLLPLHLRLDRNNYSYWRALVLAAVRAYELDGHILVTNPIPPMMLPGNVCNPCVSTLG